MFSNLKLKTNKNPQKTLKKCQKCPFCEFFGKMPFCGQTVLPDRSIKNNQKSIENANLVNCQKCPFCQFYGQTVLPDKSIKNNQIMIENAIFQE